MGNGRERSARLRVPLGARTRPVYVALIHFSWALHSVLRVQGCRVGWRGRSFCSRSNRRGLGWTRWARAVYDRRYSNAARRDLPRHPSQPRRLARPPLIGRRAFVLLVSLALDDHARLVRSVRRAIQRVVNLGEYRTTG